MVAFGAQAECDGFKFPNPIDLKITIEDILKRKDSLSSLPRQYKVNSKLYVSYAYCIYGNKRKPDSFGVR